MLKRKKQSLKELNSQISQLTKQNEIIQNELNEIRQLSDQFPAVSKVLEHDRFDLLLLSPESMQISLLSNRLKTCVFGKTPTNINEFFEVISTDDNQLILNWINKAELNKAAKFQAKLQQTTESSGKETITVELTVIKHTLNEIILVIRDITTLSKQQRELIKTKEKVEQYDKLKTTLLSNISHQIRTPLNSINGFSELIANSQLENSQRKEYIDIIKRQSKRILTLIDDISEINKLESGSINISKTACNLKLLLNELLIGLNQQRSANRKELVNISVEIPQGADFDILTDSGRLQQVILNIANYSLRRTEQGTIRIGYNYNEETGKVDFFISDTSDGLNKEEQKVLFDRFMVIDNTENTKFDDPGLGLTIAKETVKALGGRISVESEPGSGVKFLFSIPFEKVANLDSEESFDEVTPEENYNWANKVILVVDDEDVNAMFLDAVLQITGVQVLFAKNGLQALELVKNINKIDLILMDIKMPVMNGIKATREIRKFNQTIPIIAQTALASEEDKMATTQAGCNNTVIKPIEVAELLQLINTFFTV